MSRSPLTPVLSTALHLLRAARRRGQSCAELAATETDPAQRWHRRDVLKTIGALGAVAALAAVPGMATAGDPPHVGRGRPRVVIVGAGIAGLNCARRLRAHGVSADIYEANTRIGGRMLSDRTTFSGQKQVCELGGELIDTSHVTIRRLARKLGLKLEDKKQDMGAGLTDLVGYFGGRNVPYSELLNGFAPIAAAIDSDLESLIDPDGWADYTDDNGIGWLDALSISEWLDGHGFSGPARDLIEAAYATEWGLDTHESNALNLLGLISTTTKRIEIFGSSDERFHVVGGNDQIPRLIAADLDQCIRTGWALEALSQRPGGSYELTFATAGGTRTVMADRVVLAIPFSILRTVAITVDLPAVKRRAIAELGYGQNTKTMVGLRSRPWRTQGSDGQSFSDVSYQNSWDTTQMQPGAAAILTEYTGGSVALAAGAEPLNGHATQFVKQIDRVYPGCAAAHNGKRVRMAWNQQPWVGASYSAYRVGQYTTIAGAEGFAVGCLHFAGEHTDPENQGYMEGGAASGERAADEILAGCNIQAQAE